MRTSTIFGIAMTKRQLRRTVFEGIFGAAVLYGVFFAAIAILNTLEGIIK